MHTEHVYKLWKNEKTSNSGNSKTINHNDTYLLGKKKLQIVKFIGIIPLTLK